MIRPCTPTCQSCRIRHFSVWALHMQFYNFRESVISLRSFDIESSIGCHVYFWGHCQFSDYRVRVPVPLDSWFRPPSELGTRGGHGQMSCEPGLSGHWDLFSHSKHLSVDLHSSISQEFAEAGILVAETCFLLSSSLTKSLCGQRDLPRLPGMARRVLYFFRVGLASQCPQCAFTCAPSLL